VKIIGPDLILRIITSDHHIGGAAVAPVEDENTESQFSYMLGQRFNRAHVAAPAR
jgi:hypothetical protein